MSLGFAEVAKHRSKQAWLYQQGDISFVVNAQPHSQAEAFAKEHGPRCVAWRFGSKTVGKRWNMYW
ncbi:4-hydroxyphenylpyruvate dioxygenase [Vibrio ponticus]|nr:4-hydroxyphenylpyruvate dioxygenase [Vibrio ponticus]